MIKALITDLGNVLVKFDHMIACRRLLELSPDTGFDIRDVYEKIICNPIIIQYEKGLLSSKDFFSHVCQRLKLRIDYLTFSKVWAEIFERIPEMEDILIKVKSKMPVYLVSNTNELHFQYVLRKFPILQQLKGYVLSYQIGYMKPEEEIYQAVLKQCGLPANECLYIDDIKRYVQRASELGFHCIHFVNPQQLKEELNSLGLSF